MGKRNLESNAESSCKIERSGPEWIRICRDTKFFDKPVLGEVREASEAWDILEKRVTSEEQEVFYVICLDSQMKVLSVSEVARGTANNLGVHIRDIFRAAIIVGAVYIIVAHNHPSGVLKPSRADINLTKECVKAGRVIGIDVVDHLVVTGSGFYSFSDAGNANISKYDFYSISEPKPTKHMTTTLRTRILTKGTDFFGKRGFELSNKTSKGYVAHIRPYLKKHKSIRAGTLKAPTLVKLEEKLDMLIESLSDI